MTASNVHIIPILRDNYAYLIEGANGQCLIVDPGQPAPVRAAIAHLGLTPVMILNTHHHPDHVAGNAEMMAQYNVPVIVPRAEFSRIPQATGSVSGGETITAAGITLAVIDTPGHTKGHVVFHDAENGNLFSGDTLFSMGCGRLLEGTAEEMFESLQKLKTLPAETRLYCGHEYTESNGDFAASLGQMSGDLEKRRTEVKRLRMNEQPTLPVTLAEEMRTNPFLMASTVAGFARLRIAKDNF